MGAYDPDAPEEEDNRGEDDQAPLSASKRLGEFGTDGAAKEMPASVDPALVLDVAFGDGEEHGPAPGRGQVDSAKCDDVLDAKFCSCSSESDANRSGDGIVGWLAGFVVAKMVREGARRVGRRVAGRGLL